MARFKDRPLLYSVDKSVITHVLGIPTLGVYLDRELRLESVYDEVAAGLSTGRYMWCRTSVCGCGCNKIIDELGGWVGLTA